MYVCSQMNLESRDIHSQKAHYKACCNVLRFGANKYDKKWSNEFDKRFTPECLDFLPESQLTYRIQGGGGRRARTDQNPDQFTTVSQPGV